MTLNFPPVVSQVRARAAYLAQSLGLSGSEVEIAGEKLSSRVRRS